MTGEKEKKFLNAFLRVPGVGYETIHRIREYFPSYETAWNTSVSELSRAGITHALAEKISDEKKKIDPEKEYARLEKEQIWLIERGDKSFPALLGEIPSPPNWLYAKGSLPEDQHTLAIVGSRKATSYGKEATERIVRGLAEKSSLTVISGLAIGIDTQAHLSALSHHLRTIAVIGSGLGKESFFPPRNIALAEKIAASGGTILSEYPLGMPAFKQNFVQRNRIISGLSQGTLVIEAAEKSGALITARFALEHGRSVMATPGSIFSPYSRGCHALLKEGAVPVSSAEDIIEELQLPLIHPFTKNASLVSEDEKSILSLLDEPRRLDEIAAGTKISTPNIISSLSVLELKGVIKNIGGDVWMRT